MSNAQITEKKGFDKLHSSFREKASDSFLSSSDDYMNTRI